MSTWMPQYRVLGDFHTPPHHHEPAHASFMSVSSAISPPARLIRILICAVALSICGICGADAIVVGTFNIRYDNEKDRERGNGWPQRSEAVAALIRFHAFDVIGIQEANDNQISDLQALLPAYDHRGCGRNDGKRDGEYAAVFFRKSLFRVASEGRFWLSETPDVPSRGWDAKFNRICVWVGLESIHDSTPLFFFNTHLDHQGGMSRVNGITLILDRIRRIAGEHPTVLVGDFNVDQASDCYADIHRSGVLLDAFDTAEERYALNGTPNGFNPQSFSTNRIDHVFHTKGFKVSRYGVLTDTYRASPGGEGGTSPAFPKEVKLHEAVARMPSDHFPILVELEAR